MATGPTEALVRVHAAAITRDDLEWPVDRLPAIPRALGGVYFIVEPNPDQLRSIARLVDGRELRLAPVEVFPISSTTEAVARSLEPGRRSKVVLAVAGGSPRAGD